MFFRNSLRSTFGYNFWANEQLIKKAIQIDSAELVEDLGVGHGSLQLTLFHILNLEDVWFELMKHGEPPASRLEKEYFASIEPFATEWKRVEGNYLNYLDRAADADLIAIVETKDQNDVVTPIPRWRMLQHVLYHSAQHRAEAALILTHLGHSPGNLDFINY